jgi:hypothetical protein
MAAGRVSCLVRQSLTYSTCGLQVIGTNFLYQVRPARFPVQVDGYRQKWHVEDDKSLEGVLAWRDNRGGGIFWLTPDEERYPVLAVCVSGNVADVTYFPRDRHPGFRCLGGNGLPEGGLTTLVYEGCDPASGEQEPNEFIVPFETACSVAKDFFRSSQMSETVSWFEL